MKKTIYIIIFIIIIMLIASSKYVTTSESIEDLAYVVAIGIDNGDNNLIKLTLQLANTDSSSGSENTSQSKSSSTTTVECANITSGLNIVNSYISKKLNLSHCTIIVFSEEFALKRSK